ncbi:hypothetical protein KKF04_05505, partial [Patescibacteria group bacterium]|nr:hypothetical protein [Patescibacteria group bacterium]
IITANDGSAEVTVTIQDDDSNTETFILNGIGDSFTTSFGFGATLDDYEGNNYMFKVSNISNDEEMDYVEFNFGIQAEITSPTDSIYTARRYTYYCPGGCEGNCGDSGTGIIIGDVITDQCYKAIGGYPEWCSVWFTFFNNDASAPAYEGGNQEGEEELYWEKTFQTVLSEVQIEHLESITVTGEIAYQSIAQFFCDQFAAECLMNGDLSGAQDVELYDWVSETWEIIGVVGLSNSTSNQQTFSVIYDGSNPQKFIGGEENRQIKARMEFNWNGIPPEGESAPCFMLIDYFTLHLKW